MCACMGVYDSVNLKDVDQVLIILGKRVGFPLKKRVFFMVSVLKQHC